MNNRVVANGTPLDTRLDNIAFAARRAGYAPALFGYTDQGVDPRLVDDPADPRLSTYEGVLPGFDPVLDMSGWQLPWLHWLNAHGYDFPDPIAALERRAPAAGRTVELDLPDQRLPRLARRADRAMVRPSLVPASSSSVQRGRRVLDDVRRAVLPAADARTRQPSPPARDPAAQPARPRRPIHTKLPTSRPSTSA